MNLKVPGKKSELVTRTVDNEVVLLIPGTGRVMALNEVAGFIWECIDGSNSREDILEAVCREFEVNREEAAADIDEFIAVLNEKELLINA